MFAPVTPSGSFVYFSSKRCSSPPCKRMLYCQAPSSNPVSTSKLRIRTREMSGESPLPVSKIIRGEMSSEPRCLRIIKITINDLGQQCWQHLLFHLRLVTYISVMLCLSSPSKGHMIWAWWIRGGCLVTHKDKSWGFCVTNFLFVLLFLFLCIHIKP